MRGITLSRESAPHPTRLGHETRARVLDRIRRALASGDDAGALAIARELERRFERSAGTPDGRPRRQG